MKKLIAALLLLASQALAQEYTSPTFNNVTIVGSVFLNPNSGFFYANGSAAATFYETIPNAALPLGTSGATIPLLSTENTWGATQNFPHIVGISAEPVVSACGTSPSLSTGANDLHGTVTSGTGSPTGCTLTWASARTNTPDCVVTSPTITALTSMSATTTALTLGFAGTSGAKFAYICMGD